MKTWLPPRWRALLFVTTLNLATLAFAFITLDRAGWLWFAPIALSINALLLTYDFVLDFTRLRGERLLGRDDWGALNLVHEVARSIGVRPPAVYVVDRPSAQALGYSRFGRRARLILTTGALDLLTPVERAAVITHQLLAIDSGIAVVNYWWGACADLTWRLGRALERTVAFVIGWSPSIANWLIRPVTMVLNTALLSGEDFARLDRATADRLASGDALARALCKLDAYAQTRPWSEPWTFASMCLVSPIPAQQGWRGLRVQPAVPARVKALAGRFPI